jgi:hypothetical protein
MCWHNSRVPKPSERCTVFAETEGLRGCVAGTYMTEN